MLKLFINQPSTSSALGVFCHDLRRRKLISVSHPPLNSNLNEKALNSIPNVLYAGFDPTADSLHVGNLLIITNLLRSSLFGCKAIALIGGITAKIGDPSGRTSERKLINFDLVDQNSTYIFKQLLKIKENAKQIYGDKIELLITNNSDWYSKMSIVEFMKLGKNFSVGDLLRLGPVRARMAISNPLSHTEFSYSIFQAYDWYNLAKMYNCYFQLGGSDQLGNLEFGYEFIKKQLNSLAFGVCLPLLTTKSGEKLGKSTLAVNADGNCNVWLNKRKTSAYTLYQFFLQSSDDMAINLLLYLSLKPVNELEYLIAEHLKSPNKWLVQTSLADEMITLIHGVSDLELAKKCSRILFSGSFEELKTLDAETVCLMFGSASTFQIKRDTVSNFGELANYTRVGQKKNGVNAMKEGAFYVNGNKFIDPEATFLIKNFLILNQFSIVSWGKQKHFLIKWI